MTVNVLNELQEDQYDVVMLLVLWQMSQVRLSPKLHGKPFRKSKGYEIKTRKTFRPSPPFNCHGILYVEILAVRGQHGSDAATAFAHCAHTKQSPFYFISLIY